MRASDWCLYSAVGRVHSLRAWRCQLGSFGWRRRRGRCWSCGVSWWLRLFYQPSRCRGQLFASEQVADVTCITQRSNCVQQIACWLYSRTWCVTWRSPRELQGCPLPTDLRTTLLTQWCRHAGHFMTASRAQWACVQLHSVAAAATS